ncbi:cutinase family protein [Dactylosporangium vinaceum]|uniref:Cutinase family protein n=1 Tax=Dactylosporangium vinaceum TaxID=53362 RepID=A0ABV5M8S6_9ACTN|nr:cutinase family protein [Dactylosporangium vinaceum]UAB99544.1 cutinase family protein [Dactylosporangium vinaceum]
MIAGTRRMRPSTRILLIGAATLAAVGIGVNPANAVPYTGSGCAAVHVITARASTEPLGEGISGALVTQIVNSSTQTVSRAAVDYPATLLNYPSSSAQGVSALTAQLTAQVQACPTQKIILVGYSQGAHVVGDVLGGGGGGGLGAQTPPISTSIGDHVLAVIQFGDPRHVVNQPYDVGTSANDGLFPRSAAQLQALLHYASRIQSYCDSDDRFCDHGTSSQVHITYLDRYQNAAASFVLQKIGG